MPAKKAETKKTKITKATTAKEVAAPATPKGAAGNLGKRPQGRQPGYRKFAEPPRERECTVCRQIKPADQFYITRSRRGSGLGSQCKECHRKETRKNVYRKAGREKGLAELVRLEADTVDRLETIRFVMNEFKEQGAAGAGFVTE